MDATAAVREAVVSPTVSMLKGCVALPALSFNVTVKDDAPPGVVDASLTAVVIEATAPVVVKLKLTTSVPPATEVRFVVIVPT